MKNIFLLFLVLFIFSACSQKMLTKVEFSDNAINVKNEQKKDIYIQYTNNTNEDVRVYNKLKRELKNKNYIVVDDIKEADYKIDLTLIFANEIDKRSGTKDILSNVNLGVSIGHVFGNVGVSGNIGTKIGTILGDSLDSKSLQMVFDIIINEQTSQIIVETIIEDKPKQYYINILEDEVINKIAKLF